MLDDEADALVVDKLYADAFSHGNFRKQGILSLDLGHAFWALLHAAQFERKPDALTADRLTAHVVAIQQPWLLERHGVAFTDALLKAFMTSAGAVLSYSLPGASAAVERANLILKRPFDAARRAHAEGVRELGWAVHALTGERAVLGSIASLGGPFADDADSEPLAKLYVETRIVADRVDLARGTHSERPVGDFATARASWFALTAARATPSLLLEVFPGPVERSAGAASAAPEAIAARLLARLGDAAHATNWELALDLASLTTVLWCATIQALRGEGKPPPLQAAFEQVYERLDDRETVDFPVQGLIHESLVVIGVCADLLSAEDAKLRELPPRVLGAVRDTDRGTPSTRLRRHFDDLHLMWRNLEFDDLAETAALRRSELGTVVVDDDGLDEATDCLIGLGNSESGDIYALQAFLLRAAAAREAGSKHRYAYFLREAALVAMEPRNAGPQARDAAMGEGLIRELCVRALRHGHRYVIDMTPIVNRLIWGGAAPARRNETSFLRDLEAFDVPDFALMLLNGVPSAADPALVEELLQAIRRRVDNIRREDRANVDVTIALDALRRTEEAGDPIDLDELFADWRDLIEEARASEADRKEDAEPAPSLPPDHADAQALLRWLRESSSYSVLTRIRAGYAHALFIVWPRTEPPGLSLVEEAHGLLDEADEHVPESFVRLASLMAATAGSGPDAPHRHQCLAALELLADNLDDCDDLSIDFNLGASAVLAERHPDPAVRAHFDERYDHWQAEDLRLGEDRLLLDLSGHRFFRVFSYYHEKLQDELPYFGDPASFAAADQLPEMDRRAALAFLRKPGLGPPEPIAPGPKLSVDYLVLGGFLFDAPLSEDSDYDSLRKSFNEIARARLSALYQLLTSLPRVSPRLAQMLRHHRERFDRAW